MTPSQERARELAHSLGLGKYKDVLGCTYFAPSDEVIDKIAAALLAHGLAERRAGMIEARETICQFFVDANQPFTAVRIRADCALPLPKPSSVEP